MKRLVGVLVGLLILCAGTPVFAQSDLTIQRFNCPGGNTQCVRTHANTSTASITVTGNLIAAGGYKSAFVFAHPNYVTTGGYTNASVPIAGTGDLRISASGVNVHRMPYAGSVIGVTIAASTALTGTASAHAEALIYTSATASRATGLTTVIGATLTQTQFAGATQARGLDNFASTEGIGCRTSSNAAFTPGNVNLVCAVIVEY